MKRFKGLFIVMLVPVVLLLGSLTAQAGNDSSIKGALRTDIAHSMNDFIQQQTIDGSMYIYDAVEGVLLKLKFDSLHSGIVKKGDFYVSCADFIAHDGRKVDIDFLVRSKGDVMLTTQALVHSVEGKKRQYHLEKI